MSSKIDHYKNIGRIVRHPPSCVADAWRTRRNRRKRSIVSTNHFLSFWVRHSKSPLPAAKIGGERVGVRGLFSVIMNPQLFRQSAIQSGGWRAAKPSND